MNNHTNHVEDFNIDTHNTLIFIDRIKWLYAESSSWFVWFIFCPFILQNHPGMNRCFNCIQTLLLLLTALSFTGAYMHTPAQDPAKKRYLINAESKLYLKGTTNVNTFTCNCTDRFQPQWLEVESQGTYAQFRRAGLRISTRDFNCHNRKIETDLEKALKAETFPYIGIELLETWQNAQQVAADSRDWFNVKAKVKITITDVTKHHQILGKARRLGANRFQLTGEKSLQMTEFGIDPPHAMFGMIKVNDWITFHFDLIVDVEDELPKDKLQ